MLSNAFKMACSVSADDMSDLSYCESCAASSNHSKWGKARGRFNANASAMVARARATEIIVKIEDEWD